MDVFTYILGAIVSAVAISSENTEETISGGELFGWWILALMALFGTVFVSTLIFDEFAMVLVVIVALLANVFLARKAVQRARDIGKDRGICFFMCLPFIGFLLIIYLVFAKSSSTRVYDKGDKEHKNLAYKYRETDTEDYRPSL